MKLAEALGYNLTELETRSVDGLVSSNHAVGVEVEIEGVRYDFGSDEPMNVRNNYFIGINNKDSLPNLKPHWLIVRDNSLRFGSEFIFNGPRKGVEIVDALEVLQSFFDVYKQNPGTIIASDRCSIHVHLDIRDIEEERLNRLLMFYVLIERLLFKYVHPSRSKNNYCRPIVDSSFKFILKDIVNSGNYNSVLSIIGDYCDKYSALNLLPIKKFGSVEFRHHQGTSDMKEVLEWINIILSLKMLSQYPVSTILYQIESKGYEWFLKNYFAETPLSSPDFIDNREVKTLFNKGLLDFKEIANFNALMNISDKCLASLEDKKFFDNFIKTNNVPKKSSKSKMKQFTSPPFAGNPYTTVNEILSSSYFPDLSEPYISTIEPTQE